jgi:hypothetical protein
MDPIVCLLEAEFQVFYHKDFTAAAEMLSIYHTWRNKGGFNPKDVTGEFISAKTGDKFAAKLRKVITLLNDRKV